MATDPGPDIVKNGNFLKNIRDLKGPGNPHSAEEMGGFSGDILIFKKDRSCGWFEPAADDVKQGCLARPVRPDDRMPFILFDDDLDTFQDFQP